jgi:hypothetical protein
MERYWLSFIPLQPPPHPLALDRTCWLMLVNFPLDCASEHCIAAALNSFCNLLYCHESSNKVRQIVLVNLHSSARFRTAA